MPFCPSCSKEVVGEVRFCPGCEQSLSVKATSTQKKGVFDETNYIIEELWKSGGLLKPAVFVGYTIKDVNGNLLSYIKK